MGDARSDRDPQSAGGVSIETGAPAAWVVEQEGFDPGREHAMESVFSIGNGYLGVRGAVDALLPGSQGDLFIAGVYDRKQPARPYSEVEFLNVDHADYEYGEIASLPFPFRVRLAFDGELVSTAHAKVRDYRRRLALREGALEIAYSCEMRGGASLRVSSRRCACMHEPHLLLQEISVHVQGQGGVVELDASLRDPNLAESHPHLLAEEVPAHEEQLEVHQFSTKSSRFRVCVAARSTLLGGEGEARYFRVRADAGQTLTFRRYVWVASSREGPDAVAAALAGLRTLQWPHFDALQAAHEARWTAAWARADIEIGGSPATEQALRFNAYHLLSAADHDPTVSVPARALSGRAYEGHIFWDVEMFMLPFYLHTVPDVARCLLLYRHHTLPGARLRARELGYRGACFAWESTVTGADVTPRKILLRTTRKEIPIFTGTQQIHVTADVAYAVWRYWHTTHDHAFLQDAGVELLVETARFWVSRAELGQRHYHIRGVVGPDEYHHGVDDNAYTNWLARFNLQKAAWAMAWLTDRDRSAADALAERLAIGAGEVDSWADVADRLYCPEPDGRGVIEQFAGFFDLEDYRLPPGERFRAPIDRLFDWEKINQLKLIKQADVLMLPLLFPEHFPRRVLAANYHYYEPLTDHGSSLSPAVHAAIAARLGLRADAERYFRESLWLDLSNNMSNSALGLHPACMGGTWQALVFGFLDVIIDDRGPRLGCEAGAAMPESWRSVALKLAFRGAIHPLELRR